MRQQKGFTLVELLIASGIAMVLGTLLVSILINQTGVFYKQNSLVSEGTSLNDTMAIISSQIRQAVGVTVGYPESAPSFVTGNSTLVLKLPALSTTGVIPDAYDYVIIYRDNYPINVLRMETFPSDSPVSIRPVGNRVLTPLLQSLQFNYLDRSGSPVIPTAASSVEVNLTVQAKTGTVGTSSSVSSTVSLRNR